MYVCMYVHTHVLCVQVWLHIQMNTYHMIICMYKYTFKTHTHIVYIYIYIYIYICVCMFVHSHILCVHAWLYSLCMRCDHPHLQTCTSLNTHTHFPKHTYFKIIHTHFPKHTNTKHTCTFSKHTHTCFFQNTHTYFPKHTYSKHTYTFSIPQKLGGCCKHSQRSSGCQFPPKCSETCMASYGTYCCFLDTTAFRATIGVGTSKQRLIFLMEIGWTGVCHSCMHRS